MTRELKDPKEKECGCKVYTDDIGTVEVHCKKHIPTKEKECCPKCGPDIEVCRGECLCHHPKQWEERFEEVVRKYGLYASVLPLKELILQTHSDLLEGLLEKMQRSADGEEPLSFDEIRALIRSHKLLNNKNPNE